MLCGWLVNLYTVTSKRFAPNGKNTSGIEFTDFDKIKLFAFM